jgi:tetratricopeptide (TPR) repeat protein
MGWKVGAAHGEAAALPFFKRAVELDPQFAVAYAALGLMHGSYGESDLATENTSKAYELRNRASDNEKFFITAYYDGRATGNQEKARQTCEAWTQTYPREVVPHTFLAGFIYPVLGDDENAVEEGKKALQLRPDFAVAYSQLASNYARLERVEDAEKIIQQAADRKLEDPAFIVRRFEIAFLKGNRAGMEREVALAQRNPGAEDWVSYQEAFALAYTGHLQEARRMSRRAADLAQQSGHRERAALFETAAALREAFAGNGPAAKKTGMAALEISNDREVEYGTAFALALSGDFSQSQTLANDLERRFPEDTSVRFSYLPALRALLALKHGQASDALETLRIAGPYELGTPRCHIQGFFGALYPIYVRGQAYLAAHQGAEAAVEFQKILDHRGIVISDSIGAMARLQLGRAYVLAGDKTRARLAYQDFLTLWKDADPDIPVLKQAQAEYAKLQ